MVAQSYFQSSPILKKCAKVFFEDETKLKLPSEIIHPTFYL